MNPFFIALLQEAGIIIRNMCLRWGISPTEHEWTISYEPGTTHLEIVAITPAEPIRISD